MKGQAINAAFNRAIFLTNMRPPAKNLMLYGQPCKDRSKDRMAELLRRSLHRGDFFVCQSAGKQRELVDPAVEIADRLGVVPSGVKIAEVRHA